MSLEFMMCASIKVSDIVKKLCLLAILVNVAIYAAAATVKIVAETPALANAKMTEIERRGASYLGQHIIGFVGDSLEFDKGIHHISLDAPHDYIFDFSISVDDKNVSVSKASIHQKNCKPELQAVWAGPTVTVNKKGAVTLVLATPQFGPPTGKSWCANPVIVPCGRQSVALDIQTSPPGAEIWINGKRQSMRTNHLVKTELEVCDNKVDVLLRLPGKTNCNRKVPLPGTSTPRITCAFAK
ncbi:hypothetical protein [Massilia sp. BJB1822]|uniref:hypothetical protein n=1 Tax=Massilia sp. BJB1822 TaxID=2744470 RepID=UPI0015945E4D|nr:hypothetical protein [Massilia sp. BJB1822]NVD97263.1 hypothetical protein [Massilia sp. BJB1822]